MNNFLYKANDNLIYVKNRAESTTSKSIQIAYKYAKKFVKDIEPSNTFLEEDAELIQSAIVKDYMVVLEGGSSAGCVIASIFISLVLQKPILQNLAMTGQISLEGKIGRVCAIAKKVEAAVIAGLENVIIPKKNQKDFEALPLEIKNNIKVIYAETFQDIYHVIFKNA